ncbi:hypothetical protein FN846DRAFT_889721 [Sphaerosporella brunnea]|uniref:Uncharacterized protein n=1 Tax=Sphaerosporella brunnea TaxID=1250544 RepID=A0A5J5EYM8_9PEZI|nr:hypothetical protein FN846DRAFT_889721 [Sphaerosporella brunnea]
MAGTSNYVDPEFHGCIPKPLKDAIPWHGVSDLYHSLLSQNRLADASAFLRVARGLCRSTHVQQPWPDFRRHAKRPSKRIQTMQFFCESRYTFYMSVEALIACEESDKAENEQRELNAHALNIQRYRYKLIPTEIYQPRLTEGVRFTGLCERAENFLRWNEISSYIREAAEAYAREENPTARLIAYEVLYKKRWEVLEETGNLCGVLGDHDFVLLAATNDTAMRANAWKLRALGYECLNGMKDEKRTLCMEIRQVKTPEFAKEPAKMLE